MSCEFSYVMRSICRVNDSTQILIRCVINFHCCHPLPQFRPPPSFLLKCCISRNVWNRCASVIKHCIDSSKLPRYFSSSISVPFTWKEGKSQHTDLPPQWEKNNCISQEKVSLAVRQMPGILKGCSFIRHSVYPWGATPHSLMTLNLDISDM